MFVAYPLCKLRQRADFLLLVCFTLLCGKTTPLGIKLPIIRGGHPLCYDSWNKGLDRACFIHVWRIAEKNDHHIPDSRKPRRGINAWFIERNRRRILPGHHHQASLLSKFSINCSKQAMQQAMSAASTLLERGGPSHTVFPRKWTEKP